MEMTAVTHITKFLSRARISIRRGKRIASDLKKDILEGVMRELTPSPELLEAFRDCRQEFKAFRQSPEARREIWAANKKAFWGEFTLQVWKDILRRILYLVLLQTVLRKCYEMYTEGVLLTETSQNKEEL